jgi:hypothetical protein
MKTLTINQARHQANIAAKAARLVSEGYTIAPMTESACMYIVTPPASARRTDRNGFPMPPYITDTRDSSCTCVGYQQNGLCSHAMAAEQEAADLARWEAVAAEQAEWETFGRYL